MAYKFEKLSFLVVEDNPPMQHLMVRILQTFGVRQIYLARNGEEGFAQFCLHNPDIVIADWVMQPVDGPEMVKNIRTTAKSPNPYVPVILTTGFTDKMHVEEARDQGITEFLVKPFTAEQLYRRIVQIIERPRTFVKTGEFFGPDRRRRMVDAPTPTKRREEDKSISSSKGSVPL